MDRVIDSAVEWVDGSDRATVSLSVHQRSMQNRVRKLKEQKPNLVDYTENEDGSMMAHVPVSWVKISPPKRMNLTEQQRAEMSQRMRDTLHSS